MKLKFNLRNIWKLSLFLSVLFSCTEMEYNEQNKTLEQNLQIDSRSALPKQVLDSTLRAEKLASQNITSNSRTEEESSIVATTSVNYALQATVSAESTYPGYSVLKIKDGSRNTTVGPSYSWANNLPAGGRLPESVFLKFNSLRSVDRVVIYTSSGYALQNYTIQYRTNTSGSWITLVTIVGNTSVSRTHTFPAVHLMEVQIICQKGPNNQISYGRLNEVEIYGPAEPTLPPISVVNGMLAFNSLADVEKAMDYLEYKYEQYDDAFLAQNPGLTDDQYDALEESIGYNDDLPYIDFENQYGLSSKRAQISGAEDNWLEINGDDTTQDPDSGFVPDDEFRTIVNRYGELRVGSTYYVFNDDGTYYEGGAQFYSEIVALRTIKQNDPLPLHIIKHENSTVLAIPPPNCKSGKKSGGYQRNGNWRFKHVTSIWNFPWGGRIIGKTKSHKKNSNGKWKKRRTTIGVQVMGDIVNANCEGAAYLEGPYKEKKRRKLKSKGKSQIAIKTYSGNITSFHYSEKVYGFNAILNF